VSDPEDLTPAQRAVGDFAPKLVSLTDDVLFGDVWEREELPKRDRSLITVAALIAGGNTCGTILCWLRPTGSPRRSSKR
jgi:4-carboxymuconolactone decarboxylase